MVSQQANVNRYSRYPPSMSEHGWSAKSSKIQRSSERNASHKSSSSSTTHLTKIKKKHRSRKCKGGSQSAGISTNTKRVTGVGTKRATSDGAKRGMRVHTARATGVGMPLRPLRLLFPLTKTTVKACVTVTISGRSLPSDPTSLLSMIGTMTIYLFLLNQGQVSCNATLIMDQASCNATLMIYRNGLPEVDMPWQRTLCLPTTMRIIFVSNPSIHSNERRSAWRSPSVVAYITANRPCCLDLI